jgi:hypothetical protein
MAHAPERFIFYQSRPSTPGTVVFDVDSALFPTLCLAYLSWYGPSIINQARCSRVDTRQYFAGGFSVL